MGVVSEKKTYLRDLACSIITNRPLLSTVETREFGSVGSDCLAAVSRFVLLKFEPRKTQVENHYVYTQVLNTLRYLRESSLKPSQHRSHEMYLNQNL